MEDKRTSPSGKPAPGAVAGNRRWEFWAFLLCLLVIFAVLFHKSFLPQYVLHNNDGPLGANVRAASRLPEGFWGEWIDLNWLGFEGPMAPPNLTFIFVWLCGPVATAKFWIPLSLIILGLCAWVFLKSQKFSPYACILGGLAFALHSDAFSNACWGQASRPLSVAAMLLALAALQNGSGVRFWLKALMAGMAVGWGIMEGFDVAALYSVVIGAYTVYQAWITRAGPAVKKLSVGVLRLVLVAGFAAFVSAQAITGLIGTQVKGIAGTKQDTMTKQEKWDWATQWSLAKVETLSVMVPGIFGYRMDTPMGLPEFLKKSYTGGQYWGKSGRDPAWDRYFAAGKQGQPPQRFLRHSGAGNYAGPLFLATALWALLQSFRRKQLLFTNQQKKLIWFWAVLGLVCLLLAFGRYAPFFQFFYALPYASTIRNPVKFLHLVDWSLLVLFAYGAHGLCLRLTERRIGEERGLAAQWKSWWATASGFDKRWIIGSTMVIGLGFLSWMIYGSSSAELKKYLQDVYFDPASAAEIAAFSISRVGWFVLFLILALGAMGLVLSGYFSGARAKFGAALLGVVLVTDLVHANLPWIIYWNVPLKYATNPILEQLRKKSYEQRVAILPDWILEAFQVEDRVKAAEQQLKQLYGIEWAQHHFQYQDIQSLDVVQLPRAPEDYIAFESALQVRSTDTLYLLTRRWELTNTRYVLALTAVADFLNRQFDPGRERYRVLEQFDVLLKPGFQRLTKLEELTAVPSTNGMYAIIEFTGALPRAKLYDHWRVSTNDQDTLQELAKPAFNPAQTVLVAEPLPSPPTADTNTNAGTVEFVSYAPKHIGLRAEANNPAVLLLNDHYHPNWQVWVDGKPEKLLRCNYVMRGVYLPPGAHKVEFIFQPRTDVLYVSLAGIALGMLMLGYLAFSRGRVDAVPAQNRDEKTSAKPTGDHH